MHIFLELTYLYSLSKFVRHLYDMFDLCEILLGVLLLRLLFVPYS